MKGRTARAIERLKHSTDFKELTDYLESELDICNTILRKSKDNVVLFRSQGLAQHLTQLLADIDESATIARQH